MKDVTRATTDICSKSNISSGISIIIKKSWAIKLDKLVLL